MKKFILLFGAVVFAGAANATTWDVDVQNGQFTPQQLMSVKVGDMVVWHFKESGHTTTSGSSCTKDGKWDSPTMNNGETYSHTFTATGEYPYFCVPHCSSGMTGLIVVGVAGTDENAVSVKTSLQNYPNPFVSTTSFSFYAEKSGKGVLDIYTVEGKKMTSLNITAVSGQNTIPVSLDLAKGTYVARLSLDATLPEYKLIVKQQ